MARCSETHLRPVGPTISAQLLRHVADCLELTGHASAGLLARFGLIRADLDDPERLIPLGDFLAFFEAAAMAVRNPHFGLHAGRLAGSDSLGPLSFLFLSAPTLRDAFTSFTRYLGTMQEASRNNFHIGSRWATYEYAVLDQSLPYHRQDAEYSIGATFSHARQFTGGELVLAEVRFEHEMVGDYARYRDYFGCNVFFEQTTNAFSFDVAFLSAPSRALSPDLHPIITGHLQARARQGQAHSSLTERVRTALVAMPLEVRPHLAEAAAALDMSTATLQRRLREEGTSWSDLVTERCMAAAARLLRESQREVVDIALAVGYAESASFIRRFRRHFGVTPSRFRRDALGLII